MGREGVAVILGEYKKEGKNFINIDFKF